MLKWSNLLVFSVVLLLIFGCQYSRKPKKIKLSIFKKEVLLPEFSPLSDSERKEIALAGFEFYKEFLNPSHFNGQFAIAKNGHICYRKSAGFGNFALKQEMSNETPLHVASVSKVATSLAVLRLTDQGKINLDADVRRYLPEFPYKKITVRMLLNHRSGLPYYGYFTYNTWHLGYTLRNSDIILLMRKHHFPLNFPPGSHFAYCNTNFAVLALIVERITGKTFPKAMKKLIFDPLEMGNSFIMDWKHDHLNTSQSYSYSGKLKPFEYLDGIYGDKNLYTTASDLVKMDLGTYSTKFLSDSLRKQMFNGYSYEKPGKSNYGLGIRMREMPGKETYFFHTGWWHGNTACYATLRNDTICIVAISNVYSRNVYRINRLASRFGNFPFQFADESE